MIRIIIKYYHVLLSFTDKCIGRGGPIDWQGINPDITPLDFLGLLKDLVFQEPITGFEGLKERIRIVVRQVNKQMLTNT